MTIIKCTSELHQINPWGECAEPIGVKWVTPPENQGQIVTVSYSDRSYLGWYYRIVSDASDRSVRYSFADDEFFSEWNPGEREPEFG